uniref:Gag protein, putative n=1 Tax=Brugia malayi TaxID=6279 RepID=A8NIH9_BRUMA
MPYETRARIIKEKLMRPEKYIGTPTNGTDTIIILSIYEDDTELALKRLTRNKEHILAEYRPAVNLSQLSLPTFTGDLKTWKEFWSSFEASIYSQNIPDIQKLNYLVSYLREAPYS